MPTKTTAAQRYARALLELAQEEGALEQFERELVDVHEAIEGHEELREVLLNPVFDAEARKGVLRELARRLGAGPLVTNFLCLLVDKRRLRALPDIVRAYRELVDRAAGRLEAQLVAAAALDPQTVERVRAELSRWTGKQVRLSTRVEPALIGGVVARLGGLLLDGSLRSQLDALRRRLTAGE